MLFYSIRRRLHALEKNDALSGVLRSTCYIPAAGSPAKTILEIKRQERLALPILGGGEEIACCHIRKRRLVRSSDYGNWFRYDLGHGRA